MLGRDSGSPALGCRSGCAETYMPLQEQNYWLSTIEFPQTDSARPLPELVDIAVLGSGFTGLAAARTLAKRGARDDRTAAEIGRVVAGAIACVKHVFLVDGDVNIFSPADVMWALTTRFRNMGRS